MDTKTWMRYWRRAVWLSAVLRLVPFVRMVGLNGSMATGTFRKESDIDLYIVVQDGHLFLGRFLATMLIELTGFRIKPGKEAGMFCPNRFAIESFTEITPHDEYHARVFHNLIPVFAVPGTYAAFVRENTWMQEAGQSVVVHEPFLRHSILTRLIQGVAERLLGSARLEQRVAQWQRRRIAADPRAQDPGSKVIITDKELRFHLTKD